MVPHRVFSLLQPWTIILLIGALLACGGPMVRTEAGIQLKLEAVDFATVPTKTQSRRIAADISALRPIVSGMESLQIRASAYLRQLEASSGQYSQAENDKIRQLMLEYLNYREALFRMVAYHSGYLTVADERRRLQSFLIAYGAGLTLQAKGLSIAALFATNPNAVRKLNEPEPVWGIPANVYNTIYDNATRAGNVALLAHSQVYYESMQPTFAALDLDTDPDFDWIPSLIADHLETVEALAPSSWEAAFVKARRESLGTGRKAVYGLLAFVSRLAGDTKVRPAEATVSVASARALEAEMEPGDVILTRKNYYVSNGFLPGFWPHAILYVGTPEQLKARGVENRPWVQKHLAQYAAPGRDGHPNRVVEAISEGVVFSSIEEALHADYVAVLRPRLSQARRDAAIGHAFSHVGKPYDFEFDFFSTNRLVCTELVYRAYDEAIGGERIELEMQRILGRDTYPAIEYVRKFRDEAHADRARVAAGQPRQSTFDFVAFLAGDKRRDVKALMATANAPSTPARAGWTLGGAAGWSYQLGSRGSNGATFHSPLFELSMGHSLSHHNLLQINTYAGRIHHNQGARWQLAHALALQWHPTRLVYLGLGGGLAYGAREPGAFAAVSLGYEVVQSLRWALDIRLQHTTSTTRGFAEPQSALGLNVGLRLY